MAIAKISRWLAGLACFGVLSGAMPAWAGPFSSLYVFGDSLSDSGNNALAIGPDATQVVTGNNYVATYPFALGTYSDGAVWTQRFAASLGVPILPALAGGTNFAFGGAETSAEVVNPETGGAPPSLRTQAAAAVLAGGGSLPGDALYVVAGGGNNVRSALPSLALAPDFPTFLSIVQAQAQLFAQDIGDIVDSLQAAGADEIIVWNTPNAGLTPAVRGFGPLSVAAATFLSQAMNDALALRLISETGVKTFDVFGLLSAAAASPADFGLSNTTDACAALGNACDPSSYLFWDGIHPTSAGHALLADAMLDLALPQPNVTPVPEPSTVALLLVGLLVCAAATRRRRSVGHRLPGAGVQAQRVALPAMGR